MAKQTTKRNTKSRSAKIKKIARRKIPGVADLVDIHVGNRLRQRRTLLGLNQQKLGESVGLTFQQVQKYERGANRIGASRLFDFSLVLGVPVEFFFEDMPSEVKDRTTTEPAVSGDNLRAELKADPSIKRETLELVRAYYQIRNPTTRQDLYRLVNNLSRGK
ncbi:MAG: helix-turn-helix transcriptional regulator [Rhodospirillales bacterium]|jgi:transcriptional regulator with XRE-family HTH domain|nr:helix-turn-helix transcriptional regulator [Rhodospirillales bacterium]